MCLSGFPRASAGKESTCGAGDLGLILGWGDPLEKGKATNYSTIVHGVTKSRTRLSG